MVNLKELERKREKAYEDKVDLFDFYNENWDSLVDEIKRLRETELKMNKTIIIPDNTKV